MSDAPAFDVPPAAVPAERQVHDPPGRRGWRSVGAWVIGLALLSPLVAWLVVDKITDGDRTVKGMVSFGVWSAAILASICWLWGYSGWSRRTRAWVTGGAIAAAAALLFLFPPRWNGAMGISGFRYRFAPTAQQRADEFRAANPPPAVDQAAAAAPPLLAGSGDWPGLLGPQRDGKALDASIRSDWASSPPSTIWRHPVGPGWGGFSVVGDRCFTLEQLGDGETVACYDANTGDPLWSHTEPVRFDFIEPNGGDGPRSTPLFHEGAIYSMGATGLVTCLDARTGDLRWKRALIDDPSKSITWGLSCSPLAVDGAIVVLPGVAAGPGSAAVGLDPATGDTLWASGESRASYSSPSPPASAGWSRSSPSKPSGSAGFPSTARRSGRSPGRTSRRSTRPYRSSSATESWSPAATTPGPASTTSSNPTAGGRLRRRGERRTASN